MRALRTILGVAAAIAASVVLPAVARAEYPAFNPVGNQSVLVIPLWVPIPLGSTGWVKDCIGANAGDKTYTADLAWAKSTWLPLWAAPGHSANKLQGLLNSGGLPVSADYVASSHGKTTWTFKVLDDVNTGSGWWPAPHDKDQYCKSWKKAPLSNGAFTGDAAEVKDAIETIIPEAIRAGFLTPREAASYHRVLVMDEYTGHSGSTRHAVSYNVDYGAGAYPVTFSATMESQGADDNDWLDTTEHELGHQLGLADLYGTCPQFAPATDLSCTGAWDPMMNDRFRPNFSSYSQLKLGWLHEGTGEIIDAGAPLLVKHAKAVATKLLLAPLAAAPPAKPKALRVALRPSVMGRFDGYWVECREHYNGDRVPTEGLVVYRIDEQTPGAHVIVSLRGRDAGNPNAALAPGDSLVTWLGDTRLHNLRITFNGWVGAGLAMGPLGDCSVTVEESWSMIAQAHPRIPPTLPPYPGRSPRNG